MSDELHNSSGSAPTATQAARNLALLVYVLQAVGVVIGLSAIIGIVINYVKRKDVQGTFVASHFTWQIKTFWYTLLGLFISALLLSVGIGALLALIVAIWYIYRIVKGWLALNDGKELPDNLL